MISILCARQIFYDLITQFLKSLKSQCLYKTHDRWLADDAALCKFFQRNLAALHFICQYIVCNLFSDLRSEA